MNAARFLPFGKTATIIIVAISLLALLVAAFLDYASDEYIACMEAGIVVQEIVGHLEQHGSLPQDILFMNDVAAFSGPWSQRITIGPEETTGENAVIHYWPMKNKGGQYIELRYPGLLRLQFNQSFSRTLNERIVRALTQEKVKS